jgi:rRNA maturation endonuclease Nob1
MKMGKLRRSRKYEEYYGKPYTPKTLTPIKVCLKCGRQLPERSQLQHCPYCEGTLQTKYIRKPTETGGKAKGFLG